MSRPIIGLPGADVSDAQDGAGWIATDRRGGSEHSGGPMASKSAPQSRPSLVPSTEAQSEPRWPWVPLTRRLASESRGTTKPGARRPVR